MVAKKTRDKVIDFGPLRRKTADAGETRDETGLIDWPVFWEQPFVPEDWLIRPLLPRGRSIAMYCVAGIGKSELTLYIATRAAMGLAVLDRDDAEPLEIVYLDYEMTENDLRGRLQEMGYSKESDLRHFHYYLLPSLPPLDTQQGGEAVVALAKKHKADLVIIDTTSRVISGAESDADSFRDFHQHSGRRLKDAGITVWRLDHAGKSLAAGQRGSSAKNDDTDIIWQLSRTKTGSRLFGEKRRQGWVPENIYLTRNTKPRVSYDNAEDRVSMLVSALERLKLPGDVTVRVARLALKKANITARQDYLLDALKQYRQSEEVTETEIW